MCLHVTQIRSKEKATIFRTGFLSFLLAMLISFFGPRPVLSITKLS